MSSCSIEQDENIVKKFQKTPGTPIKSTYQTPRRSSRKRSLFQPSSPVSSPCKSDDLGPMSPLSASSNDSYVHTQSPTFSPNGRYSTPPKTPIQNCTQERYSTRKRDIVFGVFPSLKINSPKSHKSPRPSRRSERLKSVNNNIDNPVTVEDILRDLTTPPKSPKKTNKLNKLMADQNKTYSSQISYDSTPRRSRNSLDPDFSSKLGVETISCESFYGPEKPAPKARTQLFIDSLGSKAEIRKRARSLSLDSISSNRSFVSGLDPRKKRKISDGSSRPRNSKKGRDRGPHVGVWHGVKKPKQMKFSKNSRKPLISPNSRLGKMIRSENVNQKQIKPKRSAEGKPVPKITSKKKMNSESLDTDEILDPFPHHLIKRKKLPSQTHPCFEVKLNEKADRPDPNKKFMKFGKFKTATLTLNENMKLMYSDGVIKLQSPKRRRKLYSAKSEEICDFYEEDIKNNEVKENIENILLNLEDDNEIGRESLERAPTKTQIKEITEERLINTLNGPATKAKIVQGSESKILREIKEGSSNNILPDTSSSDFNELQGEAASSGDKTAETGLEETGNILSRASNILSNSDLSFGNQPLSDEKVQDANHSEEKFYSLFYKENWNSAVPAKEAVAVKTSSKKKTTKIPDDQYLLDAGQKSVGIVTCGKCGVMYQAGDFADEATHKNFHDHLPELRFTGWNNERVVGRYRDGRIIMILSSDSKSWWHKITKIVDIVDQELGFPEGSVNSLFYKTVYLYISERAKQIVGCLIAEECKEAFKMFPPLEGVDVDSCSKDPSPCKVGISRVWTALNHRRRGVAKKMIDCMRRTFIFGEVLPMDLVAFSVPSPSGKLLAQSVTGKLDFLVYGFA